MGKTVTWCSIMREVTSRSSYSRVVLLCSHLFDLYDTARLNTKGELFFRLFLLLACWLLYGWHQLCPPKFLLGGDSSVLGLVILTLPFRMASGLRLAGAVADVGGTRLCSGSLESAQRLVQGLRKNPEIGVEIASWTGKLEGEVTRESVAAHMMEMVKKEKVIA